MTRSKSQSQPVTLNPPDVTVLPRSTALWRAAYDQGVRDGTNATIKALKADPAKFGFQPLEPRRHDTAAMAEAIRRLIEQRRKRTSSPGETPGQASARKRRLQRLIRDNDLATELAAHVKAGLTTEQARQKMGIGVVRSQRVRALAVKLGLLQARQQGPIIP